MTIRGQSWETVRARIDSEITSGQLSPDEKLSSEAELCRLYDVKRHSLRRALAALEDEGKLRIEHGRGIFVESVAMINYIVGTRTRFRRNLLDQGMTATGEALGAGKMAALPHVARALGLVRGAPVFQMSRRGFANDLPITVSCSYYDAVRFPDLIERRQEHASITDVYASYGITDYVRTHTSILTRPADERENALLMMRPGQAVLFVQKIDSDCEGRPICYAEAAWAGDRVQFTLQQPQDGRMFDV